MVSPLNIPVKIPIKVIPIWVVESNLFGELAKSKAACALGLPFFAALSNLFFLAEINAISDIANIPFKTIKNNIIKISIFD